MTKCCDECPGVSLREIDCTEIVVFGVQFRVQVEVAVNSEDVFWLVRLIFALERDC